MEQRGKRKKRIRKLLHKVNKPWVRAFTKVIEKIIDTRHETRAHRLQNWKQTKYELSDIKKSPRKLHVPKPLDWEKNDTFEDQELRDNGREFGAGWVPPNTGISKLNLREAVRNMGMMLQ